MKTQTMILIKDLMEFGGASLLLVIMLLLTKQSWVGKTKLIFIFGGGILCGYFFSGVPAHFLPDLYNGGGRTLLNGITTITSFMFLLYAFEKKLFLEVFTLIKDKKLK